MKTMTMTATMGDTESMTAFAAAAKAAARVHPVMEGWDSALVADVARALGADLEACKEFLFAAHRARLLSLHRLDLVEALPRERREAMMRSEITYLTATYHVVEW